MTIKDEQGKEVKLCEYITNKIEQLEKIKAVAMMSGEDIDVLDEVIDRYRRQRTSQNYFMYLIIDTVENYTGQPIKAQTRKREIVFARQVAQYFIYTYTKVSEEEIGIEFGGKDHATISHSVFKINGIIDFVERNGNKAYIDEIEIIEGVKKELEKKMALHVRRTPVRKKIKKVELYPVTRKRIW